MRLNPLHPSDNPMEELLFCFGGPSDSGDTGGPDTTPSTRDSQMDQLDQISADFDNMSQQQAAGETVTSGMSGGVGRGGSSNDNDNDGVPNSIDNTPGVDRSGFGAGSSDAFDQSRSYLDQAIANFSQGPAGAAGANIGGSGSSMIDSYLDGPMMADISTPMTGGSFVDPTTGRGIMSDIPSMDYGSMAAGANVADPSFDQGSLLGQVGPDGSQFDYSTDDIFGEPTPEQVAQQQYVSGLQAGAPSPAEEIIQFARSIAPPPSISPTESTRNEQAIQDVQDRNAVRGAADITSGQVSGTMDRGTTITPSDPTNPFGDSIFDSDEARAADLADLQAKANMTAAQIAGVTPAQQITSQVGTPAPDITISVPTGADYNFSRDVLGIDQSIPQMSLAPEVDPNDPVSVAVRQNRQARMGEVAGPMSMAPVDQTRFSGQDMMRQADDVLDARAIDEAVFGDPSGIPSLTLRAGAELVNSLESTFGGNQARKMVDVANRPGGSFVRDPATGEVLGAVGPEENIRSAFMGAQDAVYVGDPRGYEQGVAVGTSVLGPDTNVRDVGTQDPFTGQLEGRPGADYSSPVVTESRDGDGGQRLLPPPVPPEAGPTTPEEYQGRNIIGEATGYVPRGPINYAYTGLPSLAPVALRPSFRARGQYSPLFPVG